ncbi:hypothetical protein TVAG_413130 [Trichomonas vaginalis G3]|uniref:Chromo domain-containing protein n=1 Tax=Trichomonas vaginalis (strain ATCC PRA-98 / G3) TaxID=412133 RepID=A2F6J7_TRIV3|nr:chromodomain-helicase-DNA-binding protein 3-related-related family [Trichomonas vaginalis G3]EAX99495.1 hypothetical protein TVAG_413130 [Trichomonas vaginalis G3]KAI5538681.1 chromodomain-helicase-DNA-binding protein 3-related-related family [Trichomonas vaginalis G3]|eukprot:XP_001312425.1 hypothetical protein [Trichomonas vaginalis G3]
MLPNPGDRPPPGLNFSQLPENIQKQIMELQLRQLQQQQQPPPPPNVPHRGRPKGKTKPKKIYIEDSDSFDEDEFAAQASSEVSDAPRRSSRSRKKSNYIDSEDSSDAEANPTPAPKKVIATGPRISTIIAKNSQIPDETKYICQIPEKSLFHSKIFSEAELKSGQNTDVLQKHFEALSDQQGTELSDISSNYYEPVFSRIPIELLYVDRIIAHRALGEKEEVPQEIIDTNVYIPGFPIKNYPNLEKIIEFEKPLRKLEDSEEAFLDEYGVINLKREDDNKNEKAEEEETHEALEPPQSVEFLIKWQGYQENRATWESPDLLLRKSDLPFSIANLSELPRLMDIYWINTLRLNRGPPLPFQPFTDFPLLERKISLSDSQKQLVNQLITASQSQSQCKLSNPATGRIGAVAAFLHLARKQNHRVKTIIITSTSRINQWMDTFRIMTNLYVSSYDTEVDSRLIVRSNEVICDRGPKTDVLTMASSIYYKESNSLANVKWNYVVFDADDYVTCNFPNIFKIFIDNRPEGKVDFIYKENVIFVPNAVSSQIHDRLSKLLKMRNSRGRVFRDPTFLYREMYKCHQHPFLTKAMEDLIIAKHKARYNLSSITSEQSLELLISTSNKLAKLIDLIKEVKLTVVVCDCFALIRLLAPLLSSRHINYGIVDSVNREEAFQTTMSEGAILMTRNYTAPYLEDFKPDRIVFVDVGRSLDCDVNLVRYFSRGQNIQIYRLITDDSLEAVFYGRFLHDPSFDYTLANYNEQDIFLRIEALTTQPSHEVQTHENIVVSVPGDRTVEEMFKPTVEMVTSQPEFWDIAFAHSRLEHIKQVTWKKQEAMRIVDFLLKFGFSEFGKIAELMGRPQEDVSIFSRAVLLHFLSDMDKSQLARHNLVNSIIWFEFFTQPFEDQFEEQSNFWHQVTAEELTLQTPVFLKHNFLKTLKAQSESILNHVENVWTIRAFLSLHQEPYMPPRFPIARNFVGTSPRFFYALLNSFLAHGNNWQEITREMAEFQASEDLLRDYFKMFLNSITIDLLSTCLHAKHDGNSAPLLADKMMRPIYQRVCNGPFINQWNLEELKRVTQVAMDFHIPYRDGNQDWEEFHALTHITTKSTAEIKRFMLDLDNFIKQSKSDDSLIIPQRIMNLPDTFPAQSFSGTNIRDKYISATQRLEYIHSLAIAGIKDFNPMPGLPPNWDISCDFALITCIVQFGFRIISQVGMCIPHTSPNYYDIPFSRDLYGFEEFLRQQPKVIQRITSIIMANRNVPRKIRFYPGISSIAFTDFIPAPPKPPVPQQQQVQPQTPPHKSHSSNVPPSPGNMLFTSSAIPVSSAMLTPPNLSSSGSSTQLKSPKRENSTSTQQTKMNYPAPPNLAQAKAQIAAQNLAQSKAEAIMAQRQQHQQQQRAAMQEKRQQAQKPFKLTPPPQLSQKEEKTIFQFENLPDFLMQKPQQVPRQQSSPSPHFLPPPPPRQQSTPQQVPPPNLDNSRNQSSMMFPPQFMLNFQQQNAQQTQQIQQQFAPNPQQQLQQQLKQFMSFPQPPQQPQQQQPQQPQQTPQQQKKNKNQIAVNFSSMPIMPQIPQAFNQLQAQKMQQNTAASQQKKQLFQMPPPPQTQPQSQQNPQQQQNQQNVQIPTHISRKIMNMTPQQFQQYQQQLLMQQQQQQFQQQQQQFMMQNPNNMNQFQQSQNKPQQNINPQMMMAKPQPPKPVLTPQQQEALINIKMLEKEHAKEEKKRQQQEKKEKKEKKEKERKEKKEKKEKIPKHLFQSVVFPKKIVFLP